MLIDPGHHLGDSWFVVDPAGVAHCFYLRCPDDVPRHTAWEIARATSTDLHDWTLHGTVIEASAPDRADHGCIATGSVLPIDGGYLMAFTVGWDQTRPRLRLATSPDLHEWTEAPDDPDLQPTERYVVNRPWGGRPATHWRDPFLRRTADGIEALVCASRSDLPDDGSGTVAVVRRSDTGRWSVGEPLDIEPVARELECPQVHEVDGAWFLVFSTWPALFADDLRAADGDRLQGGTYAMVADSPSGPFRLRHREPIVGRDHPVSPYAGQVVRFDGGHHLIGTRWSDEEPDSISDPIEVVRDGDRLRPG